MPVVDGVDIPPPPGGGTQSTGRGPHRHPPRQQPPPFVGDPPPIRPEQLGGGGPGGAGQLLLLVGGALLICVFVWAAISVIRGAVGVVATLGGATIEAASAASSTVSDRIEAARSAVSAAVPSNPFPRETRPPRPVRPVTRPGTRTVRVETPAPSTPARTQRASNGSTAVPTRTPGPTRATAPPGPTEVSVLPLITRARTVSGSGPDVYRDLARDEYEAARNHLVSGEYRAAHARIEQTLRDLASPSGRIALSSAADELGREGEELLARAVRACQAERSVLLARGDPAPMCPK